MLTFGTLVVVALRADDAARLSPADWAAIRFTVLQASLSALISVALAVPVARALARRRFPGRGLLVTLLGAPFLLPVIVAILGLLAVFGQAGVLNALLEALGVPTVRIYGLHGVVLAHVFFNLPLATRLILQGWLAIPSERFRLAQSLGFSAADIQRHLEWPMLRGVLPGAFLVIFLICTTSFAVALTLGGGPRATTIELAIYQAFRFEFDLGKAALLGVLQFALGTTAALMAFAVSRQMNTSAGLDRDPIRFGGASRVLVMVDAVAIAAVALFLLTPLTMVVLNGAPMLLNLPEQVFAALRRSLLVALLSTALTLTLALSMSLFIVRARFGVGVEALAYLSISASPLVVGTGLFILLFPIADPIALALPVTALVNALMALPFAVRSLVPALSEIDANFGRLADSLALNGLSRFRVLVLPRIRRPLGFAAGLSAALSMGDLGVIALFADPNTATLPLQLYRLMGSYRMDEAAGAALLLLIAALALFWVFDRGGRVNADL
ncbi:MAG: thiamine/thiamine pyrophosphate ABC transporter permease ThiP [Pseudomonadota bacterium]